MAEEVQDAQLEGEEEIQEAPTPVISAGSTDAGSEAPSYDADALAESVIEKLSPTLDNLVDARFKSGKDKRFAKVDEIASWVEAAGGDFSKIRGALTESELTARIEALEAGSGGAGGAAPAENTVEANTADILDEAGISYDDPVIVELSEKAYKSSDDWYHAVNREVAKRAKQANVGPSATVGEAGRATTPVDSESYDGLAAQLAKLRGKFDPETNQLREEIQSKMEGLEPGLVVIEG